LQGYIKGLNFDIHGHADMTEVFTALGILDEKGQIATGSMQTLAN